MSVVQKIVSILLTFIGRQIFLRVLSVEYLGINRLFGDILSMLSLADLGLATAMAYSFYKPLADKDEDKLAALIGFYKKIYNIIAAAVAVIGLALTPFLRLIINLDSDIPYIEGYYIIALAGTVISYLFVYKATIITADQRSRIVMKYSIWTNIAALIVQIAILLITGNYTLYCLVTIASTLANNLLISWKANRLYPFIKRKVQLNADDRRNIFKNIGSMFIYKIANVVFNGTDNIFISAIISTAVVGKYGNYQLAVTNLAALAYMIFNSLSPSVGNLIARESQEKRMRVFGVTQTVSYWLCGFFVFCLYFLMDDFVILWLGDSYVFDSFTKISILIGFYLSITLYPITSFREATGIYQKTKFAMVAAAVLKIVFSLLLGKLFGLAGIILATTVSKLLTYAWYEPMVLFRDYLGGSALSYLYGHALNLVMLAACIAAASFLLPWKASAGWLSWAAKGAVYTLCINAVYFLRYFRTPAFQEIVKKSKGLLKRS